MPPVHMVSVRPPSTSPYPLLYHYTRGFIQKMGQPCMDGYYISKGRITRDIPSGEAPCMLRLSLCLLSVEFNDVLILELIVGRKNEGRRMEPCVYDGVVGCSALL